MHRVGGGGGEDGSLTRASEQKIDVIAADVGGSGVPVLRKKAVWQVSTYRVCFEAPLTSGRLW